MNAWLDIIFKKSFLTQVILVVLFFCSIMSWSIILYKSYMFYKAFHEIKKFERNFWSGINLSDLYQKISVNKESLRGLELIFFLVFKELQIIKSKTTDYSRKNFLKDISRIISNSINKELEILDNYISVLGILGSIAPYIGLLGTVWGIIKTFDVLGSSYDQITLSIISPGISESLIATMISLLVAIPNVVFFNVLKIRVSKIENKYLNFSEELKRVLYYNFFSINMNLNDRQKCL